MRLSERVLARRYALALYLSAAEHQEEQSAGAELEKAWRALSGSMAAFKHPRISAADKKAALARRLGPGVSRRVLRFLELLVDKKRFDLLPDIVRDFGAIDDERRGIVRAAARSAGELPPQAQRTLAERLEKISGKKVQLDVTPAPELLAGAVVRMGDWVFDGSLRGRLQRLRRELAGR